MTRLDNTINRLEVHIRALAAAAAQAQMGMQSPYAPGLRWSDRYDTLARNLAEPALDELATLRQVISDPIARLLQQDAEIDALLAEASRNTDELLKELSEHDSTAKLLEELSKADVLQPDACPASSARQRARRPARWELRQGRR